ERIDRYAYRYFTNKVAWDTAKTNAEKVIFNNVLVRHLSEKVKIDMYAFIRYLVPRLYENIPPLKRLRRPTIVLIGGTTASGKSTSARSVAKNLGMPYYFSADPIREVQRKLIPKDTNLSPADKRSSFQEDPAEKGFIEHGSSVIRSLNECARWAVNENRSMVIEGVHLIPGLIDPKLFEEANVVQIIVTVADEEGHAARIEKRGKEESGRGGAGRYLKDFDKIRKANDLFDEQARSHGVVRVDNSSDFTRTISEVLFYAAGPYKDKAKQGPDERLRAMLDNKVTREKVRTSSSLGKYVKSVYTLGESDKLYIDASEIEPGVIDKSEIEALRNAIVQTTSSGALVIRDFDRLVAEGRSLLDFAASIGFDDVIIGQEALFARTAKEVEPILRGLTAYAAELNVKVLVENLPTTGNAEISIGLKDAYGKGVQDIDMEAIVLADENGEPAGMIEDGDAVFFACKRGEREIQITLPFVAEKIGQKFTDLVVKTYEKIKFGIMTLYHDMFDPLPVAFRPMRQKDPLVDVLSGAGKRFLLSAESEKINHITYFFKGQSREPMEGEEIFSVDSPPKDEHLDRPELSLPALTKGITERMETGNFDFVGINLANCDVIGHYYDPTDVEKNKEIIQIRREAAEAVDEHLGILLEAAKKQGYSVIVTADHGVGEVAVKKGKGVGKHTTNLVPFIVVDPDTTKASVISIAETGRLGDVAPTVLDLMKMQKPEEMTGQSLLVDYPENADPKKVMLIVMDGWGIGAESEDNPIHIANTPVLDSLYKEYLNTRIKASQEEVGLLAGDSGNSEAGHLNLGAGRIVLGDDIRIVNAVKGDPIEGDTTLDENAAILETIAHANEHGSNLHLIGLLSDASSHGRFAHVLELLKLARRKREEFREDGKGNGFKEVFMHMITDGRSTESGTAPALLLDMQKQMSRIGLGKVVDCVGRNLALDRAYNWGKTKKAYRLFAMGEGKQVGPVGIAEQ
ncbi:MAG: alkaline phosphatase family protein, partial [Candidatus Omnitrophota bacterium]